MDDGVGDRGRNGGSLCWCGASCPGKGLAGGTCFVPLLFVVLALALLWLSWASVLPWLTSPVLLGVTMGAAPTVRAQVKGYKSAPLLLCTDRSLRASATHKRDTLLGQAQKWCADRRGGFYRGKNFLSLNVRHGGCACVRDRSTLVSSCGGQ